MKKYDVRRTVLGLLVVMAGGLIILGCDGDDNNVTAITAANFADTVANRTFPIDGATIDEDFRGQTGTLTIGPLNIDSDGDGNPDTAVFTLRVDGSIISGTVTVGSSCTITTLFEELAGEAAVAIDPPEIDLADPCETDNDGSLRLVVDGEVFTSGVPTELTPADDVFNLTVALSPDNEVEPANLLDDRPETGTATLRLMPGNILDYTVTVNNLTASDTLTNGHIHMGDVTENGGVYVTLVNAPVQLGRTTDILFPAPTNGTVSVTGSIPLTSTEVTDLSNAANPFYVNIHSTEVGAGLVRGQLRQNIVLAFNAQPSPANEIPPLTERMETGTATLRLLDDDMLVYTLKVNDLQAGDALTNAHIHLGDSMTNGPVHITLVGLPDQTGQEGRQTENFVASNGTFEATGAFLLTMAEVEDLSDPDEPLYVNIHSMDEGGGLLRGQLRDATESQTPMANAGPDQMVTLAAGETTIDVTLDGSASSDPDGTIAAFTWTGTPDPDDVEMPMVTLEAGEHTFTLVVTDDEGADSAPDTVMITVGAAAVGDPIAGQATYNAGGCDACHGPGGAGGIGPNIRGSTPQELRNAPDSGIGQTAHNTPRNVWTDAEALDVSAFLATVSFTNDILPIFTSTDFGGGIIGCANAGCHSGTSPARGLNLEAGQAYGNIVGVPSLGVPSMNLIEPGDPTQSYLFLKHTGAAGISGSRMPLTNPTFFDANPDLLDLEEDWIQQGALDN
jgi:mono/diheme cytochrome c family protein